MKDTITVYYNGSGLLVSKEVAESLNLTHGYRIKTEAEFWGIISTNARHGISICKSNLTQPQG